MERTILHGKKYLDMQLYINMLQIISNQKKNVNVVGKLMYCTGLTRPANTSENATIG